MKQTFLNKGNDSGRLILIFAGWGSDTTLYEHINMPGWDVMLCWDYDDFSFDESLVSDYHTIYLYAWSLGVFAAEKALKNVRPAFSAAVNGTLTPVSDEKGIPHSIYIGTMEGLNDRTFKKFQMRMFENNAEYKLYEEKLPANPNIDEFKRQLNVILSAPNANERNIDWTYQFIGRNDRIFPYENQKRAWQDSQKTIEMESPHFIDIDKIVKTTIMPTEHVGSCFSKSMPTYDDNAIAQSIIVRHLVKDIKLLQKKNGEKLLEIGCGTGLFTNKYSEILNVKEATLIDLCEIPELKAAGNVRYIKADAEQWLEKLEEDEKYDYILSSSTIQWFGNTDRFFLNCKKHLKDNGIICISTFAPGNLAELDKLRLSPIRYLSVSEINDILNKYFSEFSVKEDTIELTFDSAFDALKHLQLTGVTASGQKSGTSELKKFINDFSKNNQGKYVLTYRPIYINIKN